MMSVRGKRELLDCTLRDGGYINDWEFGHDKIVEIFERLVSSGVDFIEVGFIDDRRSFDINRTIMPDTEAVNRIFAGLDKGHAKVVGMIDYGTCAIDRIQPCKDTMLDGIRVIFKQHLAKEALEFCRQLKNLGYLVFSQMVSATTYSDQDLAEYSAIVNDVHPYANSIVDTYGLMDGDKVMHIFDILNRHLTSDIRIGYHAHNNFQLGFANAARFLSTGTARNILADGTLYALGKSAGNAAIELLMMYMNEKYGRRYDISQVLEAIDNVIMDIYEKQYWGYNIKFYISSYTGCHPNYVSYFLGKKTLSVKQIIEILNGLTFEKKLMYDVKYAEQKYLEYQDISCDDTTDIAALIQYINARKVLLIGPGNNIKRQKKAVRSFIEEHNPIVISVNYVPDDILVDFIFLTKAKRYTQLLNEKSGNLNKSAKIIATSNVTKTNGAFTYVLNYGSLIDPDTDIIDNSLVMLLKAMIECHVDEIYLAGFDGYSKRSDNYFDICKEYSFVKDKAEYLNQYVRVFLANVSREIAVHFVTKSRYEQ